MNYAGMAHIQIFLFRKPEITLKLLQSVKEKERIKNEIFRVKN